MTKSNDIYDYTNLIHEIFHYIFIQFDGNMECSYASYLLTEIEGLFANLLL